MEVLKTYGKAFLITLGIIFITSLIITTLQFFNLLSTNFVNVLKLIIPIVALFVGGILVGKDSNSKGWLEGLKYAIIFLVILLLFNYLGLNHKFLIKDLIYYLIIIVTSITGGMLGINLKKEAK